MLKGSHTVRATKWALTLGLGMGSRRVRAHEAGPYIQVGNRHSDVGNKLSNKLGLIINPNKRALGC